MLLLPFGVASCGSSTLHGSGNFGLSDTRKSLRRNLFLLTLTEQEGGHVCQGGQTFVVHSWSRLR